jgi:hypothetical protein
MPRTAAERIRASMGPVKEFRSYPALAPAQYPAGAGVDRILQRILAGAPSGADTVEYPPARRRRVVLRSGACE